MPDNLPARSGYRQIRLEINRKHPHLTDDEADRIANQMLLEQARDMQRGGIPATLIYDEKGNLIEIVVYSTEGNQ